VRLSRAVSGEDVGPGDVLKRANSAVGVKPCGGCERCAAALNRRLFFRSASAVMKIFNETRA
jgi:hypothetical protein